MATANITKARVDRMAIGDVLWDDDVRGFGVRRRQRETSYVLKYRASGRQRYVTIGKHGSPWTADTARKEARRLLGAIHAGNDPAVQRDQRAREMTVAAVLDRYLADHVATHNKPTTRAEAKRHVETVLKPAFGKLRISEISRADVKSWHSSFRDKPYEGNRSLAYLRKALSLSVKEWELRTDNPALGIKAFPEIRRERFFSDTELQQIGKALAAIEAEGETLPGCIRVMRLLALTGMRLSEVVGLRWVWIDFDEGCARLPDAKAGARAVPLGGAALAYLSSLDRVGAFVCYGTSPEQPVGLKTVKRFWPRLRDRAGLTDCRMHDFRHTVGTFAAFTGANGFVVRDVLGHRSMSTTEGYVARLTDPLRKTADQVANRIDAAMAGGAQAQIIPLRKLI